MDTYHMVLGLGYMPHAVVIVWLAVRLVSVSRAAETLAWRLKKMQYRAWQLRKKVQHVDRESSRAPQG